MFMWLFPPSLFCKILFYRIKDGGGKKGHRVILTCHSRQQRGGTNSINHVCAVFWYFSFRAPGEPRADLQGLLNGTEVPFITQKELSCAETSE